MRAELETTADGESLAALEDGNLRVNACARSGGEISSIRVKTLSGEIELIHRANEFGPSKGWRGRAPLLWPAVGRTYTRRFLARLREGEVSPRDGEYELDGTVFPLQIHGFAMRREWRFVDTWCDEEGARALFELTHDEETLRSYPFRFRLEARYTVAGSTVTAAYTVTSDPANKSPMPFSIGNHITFRVPWGWGDPSGYTVTMPAATVMTQTPEHLPDGGRDEIDMSAGVKISDERLLDTIVAGLPAEECRAVLASPDGLAVRLDQRVGRGKELTDSRWCVFVMYGILSQDYFCVEPWYGVPNALNTGEGLVWLPPGESLTWEMDVSISAPWLG